MRRTTSGLAGGLCLALVLGGAPAQAAAAKPSGSIMVSAAASLADVFPAIAKAFHRKYPRVQVRFNFGGSSTLVEQLAAGAPVDVLATASAATMAKAGQAKLVVRPAAFASNRLEIVVPAGNPAHVTSLQDLANPAVKIAVCASAVPCGAATDTLFANGGLTITPVTRELDVRQVLGKVIADEVDAGLVYVTDVSSAGRLVQGVPIPAALNVATSYRIATTTGAANPVAAKAFRDFVLSKPGLAVLRAYGFGKP